MVVSIAQESPLASDVRQLIAELDEALLEVCPPEFCFQMTAEEMAQDDTTVFVARDEGKAAACGALRQHGSDIGEVKRMYTRPEWRGQHIGGAILDAIERKALKEGLTQLVLETGEKQPAACRVYERGGFKRCEAVLDYPDSGHSVFYEKNLALALEGERS